jgi:hypothetical protein
MNYDFSKLPAAFGASGWSVDGDDDNTKSFTYAYMSQSSYSVTYKIWYPDVSVGPASSGLLVNFKIDGTGLTYAIVVVLFDDTGANKLGETTETYTYSAPSGGKDVTDSGQVEAPVGQNTYNSLTYAFTHLPLSTDVADGTDYDLAAVVKMSIDNIAACVSK